MRGATIGASCSMPWLAYAVFGKNLTRCKFLKSESWVHMTQLWEIAVAKIILSAIGRLCRILSIAAFMATLAVRSTTVPFCIAAMA